MLIAFALLTNLISVVFFVQTIQNKFDDFQGSVAANTKTYRAVDNLAKKLVAEGHTDTVAIKEQQDILRCVATM